MEQIKLSVIVPVYNLGKYIGNTVNSICNQTYKNLEIIIVNDGSEDKSKDIITELAKKDSRIHLINKKNEGVTKARITGIEVATGEWIGFVDGDDYVEPEMFEHLIINAIKNEADISHCGYQMVFPNRVDYYYNSGKKCVFDNYKGIKELLTGRIIEPGLCNKIYKRDIVKQFVDSKIMDLSIKNNEDLLMNYYLFKKAKKSIYEDFCPYHYIVRKGSAATATLNENKVRDPRRVLEILIHETEGKIELQKILKERLIAQLVNVATLSVCNENRWIIPYKKSAKESLRKMLHEILKENYSKKQKIQSVWVSIWPWSYSLVHWIYAKVTGIDKKYDVVDNMVESTRG